MTGPPHGDRSLAETTTTLRRAVMPTPRRTTQEKTMAIVSDGASKRKSFSRNGPTEPRPARPEPTWLSRPPAHDVDYWVPLANAVSDRLKGDNDAKAVLMHLLRVGKADTMMSYHGQKTIASALGMGVATVKRALIRLRDYGYVEWASGHKGRSNLYQVTLAAMAPPSISKLRPDVKTALEARQRHADLAHAELPARSQRATCSLSVSQGIAHAELAGSSETTEQVAHAELLTESKEQRAMNKEPANRHNDNPLTPASGGVEFAGESAGEVKSKRLAGSAQCAGCRKFGIIGVDVSRVRRAGGGTYYAHPGECVEQALINGIRNPINFNASEQEWRGKRRTGEDCAASKKRPAAKRRVGGGGAGFDKSQLTRAEWLRRKGDTRTDEENPHDHEYLE